jgi:DHA1 family tetracycline resistance protein-like MFS transporter
VPRSGFVFAIVLIDMLGFGIVMPVMPQLIMDLADMSIDSAAVSPAGSAPAYAVMQFRASLRSSQSFRSLRPTPGFARQRAGDGVDYTILGFAPALWFLVIGRSSSRE